MPVAGLTASEWPYESDIGSASAARHGVLPVASHINKIIGKLCAGKPHAQFERGLHGNGPALALEPRHNLPMRILRKSTNSSSLVGVAALSVAIGATAVGVLAIGALAIGRIAIRQGRIEKLSIGELTVDKLIVREQVSTTRDLLPQES
jgi:hypothetical protein